MYLTKNMDTLFVPAISQEEFYIRQGISKRNKLLLESLKGEKKMTPEQILLDGANLMKSKREDYSDGTIHQNFERSELIVRWFNEDIDKVYITLITTKLARLATLLNKSTEPNNESIKDSFVDLTNYCALWGSKRIKGRSPK